MKVRKTGTVAMAMRPGSGHLGIPMVNPLLILLLGPTEILRLGAELVIGCL